MKQHLARFLFLAIPILFYCLPGRAAETANSQPHIIFVTGDHEYGSERTMPFLAKQLEKNFRVKTTVLLAARPDGKLDENYEQNIPGLEKLEQADLAVFFLRWRQLPADQVAMIEKYLKSGKPVAGFRTSTHAFNYPKGHELQKWNAFGEVALGSPPGWGAAGHTHYGHASSTDVFVNPAEKDHPVLKGVDPEFHVRSWLYRVKPEYPIKGSTELLIGRAVDPDKQAIPNPVVWLCTNRFGGRAFTTTLGHPEDFQVEAFQRVVVNGFHWALGKPMPEKWPGKMPFAISYEKAK